MIVKDSFFFFNIPTQIRRNFVTKKILTGPVVIVSIFMAQIDQLAAITIAFGVLGIGGIYIVPDVFIGFERGGEGVTAALISDRFNRTIKKLEASGVGIKSDKGLKLGH